VRETFERAGIQGIDKFEVATAGTDYKYRNKMEYSFYHDDEKPDGEKLSLAFFRRGSHGKIPVETESLAMPQVTEKANENLGALNHLKIEGRQRKTRWGTIVTGVFSAWVAWENSC
jgi:23S rRNA (uracil1939-C5)-methyltransferase